MMMDAPLPTAVTRTASVKVEAAEGAQTASSSSLAIANHFLQSLLDIFQADGKIILHMVRKALVMNPKDVENDLIEVLQQIQRDSGYAGVAPIDRNTCPTNDLEGFDSLLWAVAICMLQDKIGFNQIIPETTNIFFDPSSQKPLSIAASAQFVCNIVNKGESG